MHHKNDSNDSIIKGFSYETKHYRISCTFSNQAYMIRRAELKIALDAVQTWLIRTWRWPVKVGAFHCAWISGERQYPGVQAQIMVLMSPTQHYRFIKNDQRRISIEQTKTN